MNTKHKDLMKTINDSGDYNDDIESRIDAAVKDFKENNTW